MTGSRSAATRYAPTPIGTSAESPRARRPTHAAVGRVHGHGSREHVQAMGLRGGHVDRVEHRGLQMLELVVGGVDGAS